MMFRNFLSAHGSLITLMATFSCSVIIGVFITIPDVKKSVFTLQKQASDTEKRIAGKYIEQYISYRVEAIRDITRYPIVKNGVMGAGISPEDLVDFLSGIPVLGKFDGLTLLNVLAEEVYSRAETFGSTHQADSEWFKRLIDDKSDAEVNLINHDHKNYLQIAVPVKLNNYTEGVLVSEIEIDIDVMLSFFFPESKRSLTLSKNGVVLTGSVNPLASGHVVSLSHKVSTLGIEVHYYVDAKAALVQQEAFLANVLWSIVITFFITFLVLVISGNAMVVTPYKRLQELTNERKKAKLAAEESSRAKSEFLANMSHEIRTPLNGILGMLSLISRNKLDQQQAHYVSLARSSADSLLSLINDILDFSKVEAGKLDFEELDFNIKQLLEDSIQALVFRAEEKQLELILDTTKIDRQTLIGDPGRLRQVITNLVGNAIKFTQEGEIVVRARLENEDQNNVRLICSVTDTGIGIPQEKLAILFDSFSQVDASNTRQFGGTGLGLAIVKNMCGLMHGEISVSSIVGQGSEFSFNVLLKSKDEVTHHTPELNIDGRNIMVVDDNATNREILRYDLEQWGANVLEAEDGEAALSILKSSVVNGEKSNIAIAILDMQMPGMDGAALSKKIRSNPQFTSLKLVMMTSVSARGDTKYFSDLGFSAYFSKPISVLEFKNAMAVIIEDGPALRESNPLLNRHNLSSFTQKSTKTQTKPVFSGRVLLVEDNTINQEVALGILKDMGLYADTAANGVEALCALKAAPTDNPYRLILMDCQMPEMDGYQATQEIRSASNGIINSQIPIIAMTANAMRGDREKCLTAGMNDYITKPIDRDILENVLSIWLSSPNNHHNLTTPSEILAHTKPSPHNKVAEPPIWDKEALLTRVRGRTERAQKLIDLFFDLTPLKIKALEEAIASEQVEEAKEITHSIKGSTANLGGLGLEQLASELELAEDAKTMQSLWPEFKQRYITFSEVLRTYTIENGK